MTSPAEKLRKLMALYNDKSTTIGERAACMAAIERIKASMPKEQAREAEKQAKAATSEQDFVRRKQDRTKRQRTGFQRAQEEERARSFVRDTVDSFFRRHQPSTAELFEQAMKQHNSSAGSRAYPSAYGDRGK